ncbi:MAG: hypothetical protein ABSG31_13805 [Tepidisphaeraceae bacterium]|jgi:Amt family ammonium transporter
MITPWIMLSAAALLLLNVGMGLFQAGVSRNKNAAASFFRSLIHTCVGILAFWAIGGAILSGNWHDACDWDGTLGSAMLVPALVSVMSANIVAGAMLERSRSGVGVIMSILMAGAITPLAWHLAWSQWLASRGFADVAGATFVHLSAGLIALIGAILLGPREAKFNRDGSTNAVLGHSVVFMLLGAALIFVTWGPYIMSCIDLQSDSAQAPMNAILAGAAGACAAVALSRFRYGKTDIFLVISGLLGGLISISGGADRMIALAAVAAGAIAGILVPLAAVSLELRWKIDDPAASIAIHGVGGLWAALATGLLAHAPISGIFSRLLPQLLGVGLLAVLSLIVGFGSLLFLKATIGLRIKPADELDGLDLAEHDLNAYPDFQQTTIKSYHLREM